MCNGVSILSTNVTEIKPELRDVLKELYTKVADRWEDLGIFLGIESGKLDAINSENRQVQSCLREMLKVWLKSVDPPPSWQILIKALRDLDELQLSEDLKKLSLIHI